jgi:hypothetical protein
MDIQEEKRLVVYSMEKYGGSFNRILAKLIMAADHTNLWVIRCTWPGLWDEHANMAEAEIKTD